MSEPMPTLKARDVMQTDLLTVTPEMDVAEAVEKLLRAGFSGAPVVGAHGELLGVLSEKDCLHVLSAAAYHALPSGVVGDHMTRRVETVGPDTDLFQLTYKFHERPFRRLPVIDGDRLLIGLVCRRDVLRGLDQLRRARSKHPTTYDIMAQHREQRERGAPSD